MIWLIVCRAIAGIGGAGIFSMVPAVKKVFFQQKSHALLHLGFYYHCRFGSA
jgi:hypothetical protein